MGKTKHDSEVAAHGQQVVTACAFLYHEIDGELKLFMAKRAATKKFLPGIFELPGGHIDFGEDIREGLRREIMEELGVRVEVGDAIDCFTYTNEVKGSHSIEVVFLTTLIDEPGDITLDPEDHTDAIWVSHAELSQVYSADKPADDIEFKIVRKGFNMLGRH